MGTTTEGQLHVREKGRMSLEVGGDPELTTIGYYRLPQIPAILEANEGEELRVKIVDAAGEIVAEQLATVERVGFARRELRSGPRWRERIMALRYRPAG